MTMPDLLYAYPEFPEQTAPEEERLRFSPIYGHKLTKLIPNLKVELLEPVLCKGSPREADFAALDRLAAEVAERHQALQ